MIDVLVRVALVALLVAAGILVVRILERRRGPRRSGLSSGVTVVTGPECRWCDRVIAALRSRGVDPVVVDVGDAPPALGRVLSLPTVVVADASGTVVLRRTGRAAVDDTPAIVAAAGA
jgi:glutaredoxin